MSSVLFAATPEQTSKDATAGFFQAILGRLHLKEPKQKLAGDVEAIAADLETVEVKTESVNTLSNILVKKVQDMKASGKYAKELDPVFARLQVLYQALPNRYYTAYSPRQAMLATVRQLQFDAKEAATAEDLLARLDASLVFPLEIENPALKSWLPQRMTLTQYLKKGPILIFIMKHRLSTPKEFIAMTEDEFMAKVKADEPVMGVGIVLRGTVTWEGMSIDLDKTWNMQTIHAEITPETWLFRGLKPPKAGDYVELRGWTYYDMFHRDEEEAEGEAEYEAKRPTVCEIHPITKVTVLHTAP